MRRLLGMVSGVAAAALLASCDDGGGRLLTVDATTLVYGVVYFDANGNRRYDAADSPLSDVRVGLLLPGATDTLVRATTGEDGTFRMGAVPVGTYRVAIDRSILGDSLDVVRIQGEELVLGVLDTGVVRIAVSYPLVTVTEARELEPGVRVFVEGITLNSRSAFSDTTVHIADRTGALRATRVRPGTVFPGDSVRLFGTRASRAGQPTLDLVTMYFLSDRTLLPPPVAVTTGTAATADDGELDAALVRVASAVIMDSATVGQAFRIIIDDETGPLQVYLDRNIVVDRTSLEPEAEVEVTGLLVPDPDSLGVWRLQPRSALELVVR